MSVSQANKESPAQRLERIDAEMSALRQSQFDAQREVDFYKQELAWFYATMQTLCRGVMEDNASVRNSIVKDVLSKLDPEANRQRFTSRYE